MAIGRTAEGTGREYAHTNPNVKLAHEAFGTLVQSSGLGSAPTAGATSVVGAGMVSTAPYVPPGTSSGRTDWGAPGKRVCLGKEGCKGSPIKDHPYCVGHAKSLGLLPSSGNQYTKAAEQE